MSEQVKHTPTPWKYEIKQNESNDPNGYDLIYIKTDLGLPLIVFPKTSFYMELTKSMLFAVNNIERIEKERDDLLEAAQCAFTALYEIDTKNLLPVKAELKMLEQAITRAKDGK